MGGQSFDGSEPVDREAVPPADDREGLGAGDAPGGDETGATALDGADGPERSGAGAAVEREQVRPERESDSVHERPNAERHEVPDRIHVEEYATYFHGGRWDDDERPLRAGEERDVDWLSSDEWLAYEIDVRESGPYDLRMRVAADAAFGGGEVALVIDDEQQKRFTVPPTGGWYAWKELKQRLELPRGVHTLTVAVEEGGWKLDWLELQ